MSLTLPMIEARRRLTSLPEELARNPQTGEVIITRHGKPVLVVMSWEVYESLMETIEVMGDEEMMAALRQSAQEVREGQTRSLDEIKQELGL